MRAKKSFQPMKVIIQRDLTSERRKEPQGHPEKRTNWKNRAGVPLESLPMGENIIEIKPAYRSREVTPDHPVNKKLEIFKGQLLRMLNTRNRPNALEFYWNKSNGTYYIYLLGNMKGKKAFRATNKNVIDVLEKMRTGKL